MNKVEKINNLLDYINISWDAFIDELNDVIEKRNIFNTYEYYTFLKCIDLYYNAYNFMIDDDVDGGICFTIRSNVIDICMNLLIDIKSKEEANEWLKSI